VVSSSRVLGRGRAGGVGPCRAVAYPSAKPPAQAAPSANQSGPEELSSVFYEVGGVTVKALRDDNGEQQMWSALNATYVQHGFLRW
jgi:hypothetical protein